MQYVTTQHKANNNRQANPVLDNSLHAIVYTNILSFCPHSLTANKQRRRIAPVCLLLCLNIGVDWYDQRLAVDLQCRWDVTMRGRDNKTFAGRRCRWLFILFDDDCQMCFCFCYDHNVSPEKSKNVFLAAFANSKYSITHKIPACKYNK